MTVMSMRRQTTGRLVVVSAVLASVATGGLAGASRGPSSCDQAGRVMREPHFLAVSLPGFPDSDYPYDNAVTGRHKYVLSSDYGLGNRFRAAIGNANSVYVSASGGCVWRRAYALPTTVDADGNSGALLGNQDKVRSVAVSKNPGSHDLYVEVTGPNMRTSDARVLVSHNDGKTFTSHEFAGLELARPVTSPRDPRVVYVLGRETSGGESRLYRSVDAGDHWRQLTMPAAVTWRHEALSGLYVDPTVSHRLWAFTADDSGSIYRSDDAGQTWQAVGETGGPLACFAVWYDDGNPVVATAPTSAPATTPDATTGLSRPAGYWDMDVSRDGGRHWTHLQLPVPTQASDTYTSLIALAQPAAPTDLVTAIVLSTPDSTNAEIRAMTATSRKAWLTTAMTRRPDTASYTGASAAVARSSVGAWWLDQPGSTNTLLRYTREP